MLSVNRGEPNVSPDRSRPVTPPTQGSGERFAYESGSRPLPGYTIKRGLGRGGFGEVYYAVSDAGKEVALKLLCRHLDVELRGIQHCLNIKHPNLLAIYDVRQDERGDTWVVMEYIRGPSLDQVLASNPGGLSPEDALAWFQGLAAGVAHLHSHGIVHRDLKPGNIFWEDGVVKIGDYGLAKYISLNRQSGQTQSVGTVHYMAPEIANGRYGKQIDIYALGVILFEMLTGQLPFDGQSAAEILMKHLTAPPDLSRVPAAFRPVLERALDKDPDRRYQSVAEMLADLPKIQSQAAFVGPIPGFAGAVDRDHTGQAGREGNPRSPGPGVKEERPRGAVPPGLAATVAAKAEGQEPIWAAMQRAWAELRTAWQNSRLAFPVKMALMVGLLVLFITHMWLFAVAAVGMMVSYAVYWVVRSVLFFHAPRPHTPEVVKAELVTPPETKPVVATMAELLPTPPPTRGEAFRQHLAAMTFRHHAAELLESLLAAVFIGAVMALMGYLVQSFRGQLPNLLQAGWLYLMTTLGSWAVLLITRFWQGREGDAVLRRFTMMVIGLLIGAAGFGLAEYLRVDLPYDPRWPIFHDWDPPAMFYRDGQPMLPAMMAAFGTLFLFVRWWRLADPLRKSRFGFWGVFGPACAAVVVSALWVFPAQWLLLPAVGMGITLQLAAPWFATRRRPRQDARGGNRRPWR